MVHGSGMYPGMQRNHGTGTWFHENITSPKQGGSEAEPDQNITNLHPPGGQASNSIASQFHLI